jgi:predicted anti-sigma-YlaC factor YlaD
MTRTRKEEKEDRSHAIERYFTEIEEHLKYCNQCREFIIGHMLAEEQAKKGNLRPKVEKQEYLKVDKK